MSYYGFTRLPVCCIYKIRQQLDIRDIRSVFISHLSTFLSVCGTWIYRLLPALHAHLPCMTLLNSEECALSEKKKKRRILNANYREKQLKRQLKST